MRAFSASGQAALLVWRFLLSSFALKVGAVLCLALTSACRHQQVSDERNNSGNTAEASFPELPAAASYSYKLISSDSATFGYQILLDGKPFINQVSKPALPGTKGFENEKQAQRAAEMVIAKLKSHQMPPSLTRDEVMKIEQLKNH